MNRLTIPREIYFGRGAAAELESLRGSRAVIITGGNSIRKSGAFARVAAHINKTGMDMDVIDGIDSLSNMRTAALGAKRLIEFEPEWIVALGGGSVIDAAKVMWLLYEYPEIRFNELINPLDIGALRRKAKFAAVPTTSGQGSEVSSVAVLADAKTGVRYHVRDPNLAPDIAIIDPDMAEGMSKTVAANSGMGALCHAIEAYVSRHSFALSDTCALDAAAVINAYIVPACEGDSASRERVHCASCMAGIAASNAGLGLVQAFANKLSGGLAQNRVPHGKLSAAVLPYVIRYNAADPRALSRYARLAQTLGLAGETEASLVQALIERTEALLDKFSIPKTLKLLGITSAEFEDKFAELTRLICEDAAAENNPRKPGEKEIGKLLLCAYEGS